MVGNLDDFYVSAVRSSTSNPKPTRRKRAFVFTIALAENRRAPCADQAAPSRCSL